MAGISSRTRASPSRRLRAAALELPPSAFESGSPKRTGRRACSGCRKAGCRRCCRPGSELWLDGGHNADGGRAIANALADLEERVSRPLVLVVGMLASKDCAAFLKNFAGLARRVVAVPIPGQEKTFAGGRSRPRARGRHPGAERARHRGRARRVGKLGLDPPPRVLITGSLYLAGEVLAENGTPPT